LRRKFNPRIPENNGTYGIAYWILKEETKNEILSENIIWTKHTATKEMKEQRPLHKHSYNNRLTALGI